MTMKKNFPLAIVAILALGSLSGCKPRAVPAVPTTDKGYTLCSHHIGVSPSTFIQALQQNGFETIEGKTFDQVKQEALTFCSIDCAEMSDRERAGFAAKPAALRSCIDDLPSAECEPADEHNTENMFFIPMEWPEACERWETAMEEALGSDSDDYDD